VVIRTQTRKSKYLAVGVCEARTGRCWANCLLLYSRSVKHANIGNQQCRASLKRFILCNEVNIS
jgi:hypothetical protein